MTCTNAGSISHDPRKNGQFVYRGKLYDRAGNYVYSQLYQVTRDNPDAIKPTVDLFEVVQPSSPNYFDFNYTVSDETELYEVRFQRADYGATCSAADQSWFRWCRQDRSSSRLARLPLARGCFKPRSIHSTQALSSPSSKAHHARPSWARAPVPSGRSANLR